MTDNERLQEWIRTRPDFREISNGAEKRGITSCVACGDGDFVVLLEAPEAMCACTAHCCSIDRLGHIVSGAISDWEFRSFSRPVTV